MKVTITCSSILLVRRESKDMCLKDIDLHAHYILPTLRAIINTKLEGLKRPLN